MNPIRTLIVGFLAWPVLASSADAQQERAPIKVPVEVAKKFDANQDGVLDQQERQRLRQAMINRRAEGERRGQRGGQAQPGARLRGPRGSQGEARARGQRGGQAEARVRGQRGGQAEARVRGQRGGQKPNPEQREMRRQRVKEAAPNRRAQRGACGCNCQANTGAKAETGNGKAKAKAKKAKRAKAKKAQGANAKRPGRRGGQ